MLLEGGFQDVRLHAMAKLKLFVQPGRDVHGSDAAENRRGNHTLVHILRPIRTVSPGPATAMRAACTLKELPFVGNMAWSAPKASAHNFSASVRTPRDAL